MPATPVDGHSQEFELLAGLAALAVLEGDERARFEQHAAECERCRVMVGVDREALAAVSLTAPPMDPSPDFKARLMQRAAAELAAATALREAPARPQPIPRPANVVPLWRRAPWVSALAAVLVVGLASFGAFTYQNQPVAMYELTGSAQGRAVVIVRRSGAAELELDGIADPGPGFLYELWVIPQGGQPIAAGTTTSGAARVPLPANVRGSTVAITREQTRVDAPTTPVLMSTTVQS